MTFCCASRTLNPGHDVERNTVSRQSGRTQRGDDMSKRDHKASENEWRSNPSHNTRRDYPASRSVKVVTVLKWAAFAVVILVLASELAR